MGEFQHSPCECTSEKKTDDCGDQKGPSDGHDRVKSNDHGGHEQPEAAQKNQGCDEQPGKTDADTNDTSSKRPPLSLREIGERDDELAEGFEGDQVRRKILPRTIPSPNAIPMLMRGRCSTCAWIDSNTSWPVSCHFWPARFPIVAP